MMSKITPNNYDAALKAAQAFEKANAVKEGTLTDRLPKEIKKADGLNHYHLLCIKKRHDSANERYIVAGNVQTFAKGTAFEKFKKNFKTMGIASVVILHDPTKNPVETAGPGSLAQHEQSAIDRQIEQEEKDAMNKRIEARKAEAKDKAIQDKAKQSAGSQKPAPKSDELVFEGIKVTEANVDEFAKENKVDLKEAKTPEGKLAIVKKFIEASAKKK